MEKVQSGDLLAAWERCRDPGYTPGVRDVAELLSLWEQTRRSPDRRQWSKLLTTILSRGEPGVARELQRDWAQADGEQRAMRLRVLAKISQRTSFELGELLLESLRDPEPKVVREAARAVGKLEGASASEYEAPLLAICEGAALPERRAAVDALGRIGRDRALERLRQLEPADDDFTRRIAEATTLIARRSGRSQAGHIRRSRALPEPTVVVLRCREGATTTAAEQVAALLVDPPRNAPTVKLEGRHALALRWSGGLDDLYRVRSALHVALSFPLPPADTLVERVVAALRQPQLLAALDAWTEGPRRFRMAFIRGGRRRAMIWKVAQRLRETSSPLVNDSRDVVWTIEVDEASAGRVLCIPRGADPRFGYRHADVPAATHPTLAALLAWAARPRAGEVVWDPFCGSGSELIECAMLCPGLHLRGSDRSQRAIAAAQTNFAAAEIETSSVELEVAHACAASPRHGTTAVSLIISNPPMGRRAGAEGGLHQLLDDFIVHAAEVMAPGGRIVWLSPLPGFTAKVGRRVGLQARDLEAVDMGGFSATPQLLAKNPL